MTEIPSIGIDLGTTYCCVAAFKNGQIEIIANELGNRSTPSYVSFSDNERLIGEPAKTQASLNPTNSIFDAKRLMGQRFDDENVQNDIKHWPFEVTNVEGLPRIKVTYKKNTMLFRPEEISSMILTNIKKTAEAYLNGEVSRAVITVPAYFNNSQRQATKNAGIIAGLKVLQIINEPTAAAIAYGLQNNISSTKNILVFDLGGGTLDVAIMCVNKKSLKVKAVGGNSHLGGEDFDSQMMSYFIDKIKKETNVDVTTNKTTIQRLKNACERAKRLLSSQVSAHIELIIENESHFSAIISRSRFEDLNSKLFASTIECVKKVLEYSKLNKTDIDEIVLVGGSTRIPKIKYMLKKFFEGKQLSQAINPDEAVAYGAAIQSAILDSIGFEDYVIEDVTPLSLGILSLNGFMFNFIERNTQIPTKKFASFETSETSVLIEVYQGERSMAKDNHFLGRFILNDIPSMPRGEARYDIIFDIDKNGILTVTAIDQTTGNKKELVITKTDGELSRKEINTMIERAKNFEVDDEKRVKAIKAKNELSCLCSDIKFAAQETDVNNRDRDSTLEYCNEILQKMDDLELNDENLFNSMKTDLEKFAEKLDIKLTEHKISL